MDNKVNRAITNNSEYNSDKYHLSTDNDKIRDNFFIYMTKKELMDYFLNKNIKDNKDDK